MDRGAGGGDSELRFGRFRVDSRRRAIWVDGEPAKLGARALDILLALAERRERTVSKNELLELVWPKLVVEENNLQVHISALRPMAPVTSPVNEGAMACRAERRALAR